jgi:hypothetical protein
VVIVNLLDIDQVIFGGPFWAPISSAVLSALPDAVRGDPALIGSQVDFVITSDGSSSLDVVMVRRG